MIDHNNNYDSDNNNNDNNNNNNDNINHMNGNDNTQAMPVDACQVRRGWLPVCVPLLLVLLARFTYLSIYD